jgi:hypothetical protein
MISSIRNAALVAFLTTLVLAVSASSAYAQKGGGGGSGGGGGGGGSAPKNLFVGEWICGPDRTSTVDEGYDIVFKKDFTFTLVVLDGYTGLSTSYVGTYDFSLRAPDGFPVLTMVSKGEILLQMEFLFYGGALLLERGSSPFMEFGKKPSAN